MNGQSPWVKFEPLPKYAYNAKALSKKIREEEEIKEMWKRNEERWNKIRNFVCSIFFTKEKKNENKK